MSFQNENKPSGEGRTEKLLLAAVLATVVWILFLVYWVGTTQASRSIPFLTTQSLGPDFAFFRALRSLSLNELGDFLAGGFAPLAFGWLTIAVILQWSELRRQRHEHKETRKILSDQQKVLDAQLNQNAISQMDELFNSQVRDLGRHLEVVWNPENIEILSGLSKYPAKKRAGLSNLEKLQPYLSFCNDHMEKLLDSESGVIDAGAWTKEKSDAFIITKEKISTLMDIQNSCSAMISSSDLMQEILVLNYSLDRVVFTTGNPNVLEG